MGLMVEMKNKIEKAITDKKLDGPAVRGKIALQTGFLLSLIGPSTPDDPAKIAKLKKAAADILQINI